MQPNEEENNKVPKRRTKNIPSIAERNWMTEEETAQRIGAGHSTLRDWRRRDQKMEKAGLPPLGHAPRFYLIGRNIRYLKVAVDEWIERNSGPDGPRSAK